MANKCHTLLLVGQIGDGILAQSTVGLFMTYGNEPVGAESESRD